MIHNNTPPSSDPMSQFRVERNDYGNIYVYEWRYSYQLHWHMWHHVALRQYDCRTGKVN